MGSYYQSVVGLLHILQYSIDYKFNHIIHFLYNHILCYYGLHQYILQDMTDNGSRPLQIMKEGKARCNSTSESCTQSPDKIKDRGLRMLYPHSHEYHFAGLSLCSITKVDWEIGAVEAIRVLSKKMRWVNIMCVSVQ